MRLYSHAPAFFTFSSLFCVGSSLPFFRGELAWLKPLIGRATYSVVAVDGGPTTTAPASPSIIIQTITQTPQPATTTIIETDRITFESIATSIIISTSLLNGPETTKTIVVTTTPPAATHSTAPYSVVGIDQSAAATGTSTSTVPPPIISSTSIASLEPSMTMISKSSASTTFLQSGTPPASLQTSMPTTSLKTGVPVASSQTSAILISSQPTMPSASVQSTDSSMAAVPLESVACTSSCTTLLQTSSTSYSSTFSTSTRSYDNGQWHTSYPPWSNGTSTGTAPTLPLRTGSIVLRHEEVKLVVIEGGLFSKGRGLATRMLQIMGLWRN